MNIQSENELNEFFNLEPDNNCYTNITIDVSSYTIRDMEAILYYNTIISKKTVLVIPEKSTLVIKRVLTNYGTIINNGRLIVDTEHMIGGCLSNYGEIISRNSLENYSLLENHDEGKITSINIINTRIMNNDGIISCEKIFTNEGILNNCYKLTICGELLNNYILHNKKFKSSTAYEPPRSL
jgi:hypothetical protein